MNLSRELLLDELQYGNGTCTLNADLYVSKVVTHETKAKFHLLLSNNNHSYNSHCYHSTLENSLCDNIQIALLWMKLYRKNSYCTHADF